MTVTPKEYAKQLVDEIYNLLPHVEIGISNNCNGQSVTINPEMKFAIDLAKLSIKGIIDELNNYSDLKSYIFIDDEYVYVIDRIVYFQEVIEELDNL